MQESLGNSRLDRSVGLSSADGGSHDEAGRASMVDSSPFWYVIFDVYLELYHGTCDGTLGEGKTEWKWEKQNRISSTLPTFYNYAAMQHIMRTF